MSRGPSDCKFHIPVTPYNPRLVSEGIAGVHSFDPALLERCQWPQLSSRTAEGGCGGPIVSEQIKIMWVDNKLVFPISFDAKPLAEKMKGNANEIAYHASFVAQLDGQVAYVPAGVSSSFDSSTNQSSTINGSANSHPDYLILVESPIAEVQAIRFRAQQAVIVDPFVKHSMPIPVDGNFEFSVWHRSVNASLQLDADPAGPSPIIINLNKVDRSTPICISRVPHHEQHSSKHASKSTTSLSKHFAKDLLPLDEVNPEQFSQFGRLIANFAEHIEQITEVLWPGSQTNDGTAGILDQDFLLNWQYKEGSDERDVMELVFEELGVYRANLLMARPDGSFFVQPTDFNDVFAMIFALPNKDNGNPIEETLKVFTFRNGNCLRLEPGVWHSVPIPLLNGDKQGILFREIVAATNANLVINVLAETGHPIQFVQGA
uniref:Ureidoglycolate hydrolase n=1 Tax=Ditylenchus dipsaci TaxID=166011 RepID=A0A915EJT6_9BILA